MASKGLAVPSESGRRETAREEDVGWRGWLRAPLQQDGEFALNKKDCVLVEHTQS